MRKPILFVNACVRKESRTIKLAGELLSKMDDVNVRIPFCTFIYWHLHSPIITTGNELVKQEIADFSKRLNPDELYNYLSDVKQSTEAILWDLSYEDLKRKIPVERKEQLESLSVVSKDESAIWLIDYWCNKDVRGLIQMPFSRHWIMHIEACERIRNKIC